MASGNRHDGTSPGADWSAGSFAPGVRHIRSGGVTTHVHGGTQLSDKGRSIADRLASCHFDVEVSREFDRRDECENLADGHDLERVDAGHKRVTYDLPGDLVDGGRACSLKVAYALPGRYENRCEVWWWQRMPDDARHLFAPVLDHADDHGWVVMPAADRDVTPAERRDVVFGLGDAGWEGEDVERAAQYGRIDGEPVIVDYGRGDFASPPES